MTKFDHLVPHIKESLIKHHNLYTSQCKAELWEEILHNALLKSGLGSDWKPDYNHKVGVDQKIDSGVRISNKGGSVLQDSVEFSGSRLTKHKTIQDKLDFLSNKKEDYTFCLGKEKDEWDRGIKRYYFIVIESNKLNYHEQIWEQTYGKRGIHKDEVVGWKCDSGKFSATITKSMSDQLWTTIKLDYCQEVHEITIR